MTGYCTKRGENVLKTKIKTTNTITKAQKKEITLTAVSEPLQDFLESQT